MRKKCLIIGDSFAANTQSQSWIQCLDMFDITNLSANGISEYKILKKLNSVNILDFSHVIIVHTSPNRVYVQNNPLHYTDPDYKECDLIYSDVAEKSGEYSKNVLWYFKHIFDLEYAETVYELMVERINKNLSTHCTLHLTFFNNIKNPLINDLSEIWQKYPGNINHLSVEGNQKVLEFVLANLNDC